MPSTRPARIVMATFEFDMIRAGGLGTVVTALCRALDHSIYEPVVVLPRAGFSVPWRRAGSRSYEGCDVEIFDHAGTEVWLLSNEVFDTDLYPPIAEVGGPNGSFTKADEYGKQLANVLPDMKAGVLHLHDAFGSRALPAARAARIPSVLTVHALHSQYPCVSREENYAADLVDIVTTVSASYGREHEAFFGAPRRTRVVPNGADLSYWALEAAPGGPTAAARAERLRDLLARHSLPMAPTFAYLGRLDPFQKGVDVLVSAYQRLTSANLADFNLLIYGDGELDMRQKVGALAQEASNHVSFSPGMISASEMRSILGAVDCVLIPSLFEPFGLIQLEALAMGSLVIASRTGGLQDVMIEIGHDGGFGRLVTPGSDAGLADAMLELNRLARGSPTELLQELRTLGRARARLFSARSMAEGYEGLYAELLART